MNKSDVTFLEPLPPLPSRNGGVKPWWRKVPLAFLIMVVVPTLITTIYYLGVASPRYVSEAQFIVRQSNSQQPSSLGLALDGVGLSNTSSDAFAVHEFISSRDGFALVRNRYDLRNILAKADIFSRYPRPWEADSDEAFYKAFQRYLVVGYDSTTGISTIRVEAFSAAEAHAITSALLLGGEQLVNRLNERAAADSVEEAEISRESARKNLDEAQQQLTAFRNRERFIDPRATAEESSQLIGGLLSTVAQLRAERAQLSSEAPSSPQLPVLDSRIAAYENQIVAERAKVAGTSESLAPKVSVYQDLELSRELADRELTAASAALTSAQQESRRQKLYIDRIVNPSLPDAAAEPRRFIAILTVLISTLVLYGICWFIWVGVKEHRQD